MRVAALCFFLVACASCTDSDLTETISYQASLINEEGETIEERFNVPTGYQRKSTSGFGDYLRALPLKKHGSYVLYYNGDKKRPDGIYAAVVDTEIGNKNLQQCADAVMRLRGEYLYKTQRYNELHFNFTNGFKADYVRWRAGERIAVNGNDVNWVGQSTADTGYAAFRKFMDVVFTYAGTLSLARERSVDYKDLHPGDVFIKGGSPGHAVIVVDVAENGAGRKLYLLAQSYMPAQETQVLINPANDELSPWYELDETDRVIETPEWTFTANELKRFE